MKTQSVVIFGCGNVASYFAERFKLLNFTILQVYHPNIQKANTLASSYQATAIDHISEVNQQADIYFIAVKDSAIQSIAAQLSITNGIVLHTSGSIKLEVLNKHARAAVFYPLQTFTKGIKTVNQYFPLLIESKEKNDEAYLEQLALKMNMQVHFMNSIERNSVMLHHKRRKLALLLGMMMLQLKNIYKCSTITIHYSCFTNY